jgi:type II secretory pathway pseudopilin PulG
MVEVVVAIALIGIGLSTTIGALTKFNAFASESRNATGAYAAAMNEIDAIQSATPFTPPTQIPSVLAVGIHPRKSSRYTKTLATTRSFRAHGQRQLRTSVPVG